MVVDSPAQTRIFLMDAVVLEEMLQEPMDGEKFIMTDAVSAWMEMSPTYRSFSN